MGSEVDAAIADSIAVMREQAVRLARKPALTTFLASHQKRIKRNAATIGDLDVALYLKVKLPTVPQPADTQAPTTPVITSVALSSNKPRVTFTASTDNVAVAGYQVWRKHGTGSFNRLDLDASASPYDDLTAPVATLCSYKLYAYDPSGNVSPASNEIGVTTPSNPTTDITAPNVPTVGNPVVVGTGYTFAVTPTTDVNPADGSIVSGVDYYGIEESPNGSTGWTEVSQLDHPNTTVGPETSYNIGGGVGSDDGSTLSGTGGENWGTSDVQYSRLRTAIGDFDRDIRFNSSTAAYAWASVFLEIRATSDPGSPLIRAVWFPNQGFVKLEKRSLPGEATTGDDANRVNVTAPFILRIRQTGNTRTIFALDDLVTPVQVSTPMTADFGSSVLVGKGACNKASGTISAGYTGDSITGASAITYTGSGVAGTTKYVSAIAVDVAGNRAARSTVKTLTFAAISSSARPNPSFGMYLIGNPRNEYGTSGYKSYMSKMRTNVLSWKPDFYSLGFSFKSVLDGIAAATSLTRVDVSYHDHFYVGSFAEDTYRNPMSAYNWYLRSYFPAGTIYENGSYRIGNIVSGGPTDPQGRTYNQFAVAWHLDYARNGGAAGLVGGSQTATSLNAVFMDDVFCGQPVGGDWTRTDSGDKDAAIRAGNIDIVNAYKAAVPGIKVYANLSQMMTGGHSISWCAGLFDGGVLESIMGRESEEINSGFATTLGQYQRAMTCVVAGGQVVFAHNGIRSDGSDPLTVSPAYSGNVASYSPAWQGARYGFALAQICGDADWGPMMSGASEGYDPTNRFWVDWMSVNRVTGVCYSYASSDSGIDWLGPWVDGPQTSPYQNGMYRRRATYGEMWLNPRGNGARTISFGATVRVPSSSQDSKYNGSSVTTMAMADRDGIAVLY